MQESIQSTIFPSQLKRNGNLILLSSKFYATNRYSIFTWHDSEAHTRMQLQWKGVELVAYLIVLCVMEMLNPCIYVKMNACLKKQIWYF